MNDIFEHTVYNSAPADMVANWIAVDILRHMGTIEKPGYLRAVKKWREDVYNAIIKHYPHHAE